MESNETILNFKKDCLLTQISNASEIGKGDSQHDYLTKYNFYLEGIRLNKLNILEIGVADGKSLNLWKKYFVNSNIYGIEIDQSVINKEMVEGCTVFIGSQGNSKFLGSVCKKVPEGFDIIIDDGSHITSDQVSTFKFLFDKLNKGGVYIIEDLQTSYRGKYKKGAYKSAVDYLKNKVDDVNYNGRYKCNSYDRIRKKSGKLKKYEKMIESIHFYSGICFIFKRAYK